MSKMLRFYSPKGTFDAKGYFIDAGRQIGSTPFLVIKGSKAKITTNNSFDGGSYKKLRDSLIEKKILERTGDCFIFTQDYEFSSAGAAASVVSGASKSPAMWKLLENS